MPFNPLSFVRFAANQYSYRTSDLGGEIVAPSYFNGARTMGLSVGDYISAAVAIGSGAEGRKLIVTQTIPNVTTDIVDNVYAAAPRSRNRLANLADSRGAQMHADGAKRNRAAYNHRVWGDALAGRPTVMAGNFGYSGDRSDQALVRLDAALASGCGTLDIQLGVNDFAQATTGFVAVAGPYAGQTVNLANVVTVASANVLFAVTRAVSSGVSNIILTLDPGASNLSAAQIGCLLRYNQALREMAELYPGVVAFDLPAAVWDPINSGAGAIAFLPNAYLLETGNYVHEAAYGAYLGGVSYAALLKQIMPPLPRQVKSNVESKSLPNNYTNMLLNPLFTTTTGGTAGAGFTGSAPLGWTMSRTGGATATISAGANPDGPGNEFIVAATFTAAGEEIRLMQDIPNTDWDYGQIFDATAQVKVDSGASGIAGPFLYLNSNIAGVTYDNYDLYQRGEIGQQGGYTVDLRTQPYQILPSGTKGWLNMRVGMKAAAAGSVTYRIRPAGAWRRLSMG